MDARMSVSRRRAFEKYELRTSFTFIDGLMENVVLIPFLKYILVYLSQVQACMLGEFLCHCLIFLIDVCEPQS